MIRVPPGSKVYLHQAFRCCPFAGATSGQVHDYLEQNGFVVVREPAQADVHLLNTCGSDAQQAALTWQVLHGLAGAPTPPTVVVIGCLVSIEPQQMAAELAPFPRSARFDPRHLSGLDAVFGAERVRVDDVQPALHNEYVGRDLSSGWFHVVASTGCLGACEFCAIRRATGRPRSRPVDAVLAEVHRAQAAGLHDVLVVSTDLSAWGHDLGLHVVDLVDALTRAPGERMLAGESFEPTRFLAHFEALLPLLASGRWSWIGLPMQSGSARVLQSMRREYAPDRLLDAVERLRTAAPDLVVRSDFIYGFGDETDDEFEASLVASRSFSLPSFNAYQPRPGTAPLTVAPEVMRTRRDRAMAELHRRAQAGVPTIRRHAGSRPVAVDATPSPAAAGTEPWESPEGLRWLADHARRFRAVLDRHRSLVLDAGWVLAGAEARADAVVLRMRHADGRTVEVGLRPPAWPGQALVRGPRYAAWVLGAEHADAGLTAALERLFHALGGRG